MEKNILLRKLLFLMLLFILIFPFLHILFFMPVALYQFDPSLLVVLRNSLLQAALSTLITLCLGFFGALGLLKLKSQLSELKFHALQIFLIIPSFTPPLLVVVLMIKTLNFLPLGLNGIIFFHCLMNIGLVSVLLFQVINNKASKWFKESVICGVTPMRFICKGLLPGIKKEILSLSFYFSVLYFFSFSIPLLIGGSHYGGPEVFILEKILNYGEWGEALGYSLILFVSLFILSSWTHEENKGYSLGVIQDRLTFRFLKFNPLSLFAILPSLLLFVGLMQSLFLNPLKLNISEIIEPLKMTIIIGLTTGLMIFLMLTILSFCFLSSRYNRWLDALMNPGWVIVGFSLLLMKGDTPFILILKLTFGLSILFFPFLLRISLGQKMRDLSRQVQVAEMFPVSWTKVFLQIIFPQCLPTLCFLSGLAALWACGDFALSGILLGQENLTTLALEMKDLISSYRMEKALFILWPLLISSIIIFFTFQGIAYVCRRKIFS